MLIIDIHILLAMASIGIICSIDGALINDRKICMMAKNSEVLNSRTIKSRVVKLLYDLIKL